MLAITTASPLFCGSGDFYHRWSEEAFKTVAPFAEETAATVYVRCASQKEAIEVAKRQMEEKASWLDPDVRLEVSIRSALAWRDEPDAQPPDTANAEST